MGLTQVSENGVKPDAITHTKLGDDCVGASELVDSSNSSNRAVTQAHVRDEAIDEARLQISNDGTNGQFLQKQSATAGGLTWASVSSTTEGTDVQSTGVTSGEKFLKADLDGTSSWQTPSYPTPTVIAVTDESSATDCRIAHFTTATGNLAPRTSTNLTFNSSTGELEADIIKDSKGDVRKIPKNDQTSAYTLVASDMGKAIYISTGGVTVPQNILPDGAAVTIINNSGSNQTITQAANTNLYNTADGSTGNRILAGRGMCTLYAYDGSNFYISGAGLS